MLSTGTHSNNKSNHNEIDSNNFYNHALMFNDCECLMRRTSKNAILFSVLGVVAFVYLMLFGGHQVESRTFDLTPTTIEQTFNTGSALVFEAVVVKVEGTELHVKPTRLWKGDEMSIETRLGIVKDCGSYFQVGSTYLFLLSTKAGGSFVVDPCQQRSIKLPTNSDLDFLKGKRFIDLK